MKSLLLISVPLALTFSVAGAPNRRCDPPPEKPVAVFGEAYREALVHKRACEESLATFSVVKELGLEMVEPESGPVEPRALAALATHPSVLAIVYHPFEARLLTRAPDGSPLIRMLPIDAPETVEGETPTDRQARLERALRATIERAVGSGG